MSEMKERITFECSGELAHQIEERYTEFNGKYVVNNHNMEKFSKVYSFFCRIADDDGGEVRCFDVHPKSTDASVSIEISILDLHKDLLKQLVDVLQYVDTFEAKATQSDSLLIRASVNCVWEDAE